MWYIFKFFEIQCNGLGSDIRWVRRGVGNESDVGQVDFEVIY